MFDSFDNLDQIDINLASSWLKNPPSSIQLENYLANKILYPQTLPLTELEMKVDLAIVREAIRLATSKIDQKEGSLLGNNLFLNITLRKIIIPEKFLPFTADLTTLAWVFVDALLLNKKRADYFEDLWTVVVSDDVDQVVGSVLLPRFEDQRDTMILNVQGKSFKIRSGSLLFVPCQKDRCEISYKLTGGKLLGKQESALEVYGGKLGLLIDGRER